MRKPTTYYSLVQSGRGVHLITRWMDDCDFGTTCYREIDFEAFAPADGDSTDRYVHRAWQTIKQRNRHLLERECVA